jgi:hypothetical protein
MHKIASNLSVTVTQKFATINNAPGAQEYINPEPLRYGGTVQLGGSCEREK